MQIAQPSMHMDQDRQMLMVEDNVGNQFRQNTVQYVGHLVGQNVVQNQDIQNVRNQNGLSVVAGIANQHGNENVVAARVEGNSNGINGNQKKCYKCQGDDHYASNCIVKPRKQDAAYLHKQMQIAQKEEAGIQLTYEEFDFMAAAGACEETKRDNANCTLENNLQQALTSGTQSDKAPVYDTDGSAENDNNVISEVSSVEQGGGTVEQHPANVEETCALYDSLYNNLAIEVEKVNTHKALELEIERLLRAVVSQDNMSIVQNNSVVDLSILQTELERTKERFENCIIKKENEYAKLWNDCTHPYGIKVVKNDNVICPRIFWTNPSKTSRIDNVVPKKPIKASVKTNPITISQPHVITKNDVKSKTNGFSPIDVKSTTRTRRPQPRNNPKNDKVPSKSKSSRLLNKLKKIEENHRNLQSSSNKKHMSSECNNIKLAIQNAKSKVVCVMCKQFLITVNHDVCVLNYVNGMNSRGKKQKANVSNTANQKKHKAQGELFGNYGNTQCVSNDFSDTLIDFLSNGLWIFMAIPQRPTNYCFSKSYKAVKVSDKMITSNLIEVISSFWIAFAWLCNNSMASAWPISPPKSLFFRDNFEILGAFLNKFIERHCLTVVFENLKVDVTIFIDDVGASFDLSYKYLMVMELFSVVVGRVVLSRGGRLRIEGLHSLGSPRLASVLDL
nr:hypothetical protein [Tanacetum cinerariifolium]